MSAGVGWGSSSRTARPPTERSDAHFFAYDVSSFDAEEGFAPRTAAGIGLDSTVADLREAYGERMSLVPADGPFPDRFRVSFGPGGGIHGSLTGLGEDGRITFLSAGAPCGE